MKAKESLARFLQGYSEIVENCMLSQAPLRDGKGSGTLLRNGYMDVTARYSCDAPYFSNYPAAGHARMTLGDPFRLQAS